MNGAGRPRVAFFGLLGSGNSATTARSMRCWPSSAPGTRRRRSAACAPDPRSWSRQNGIPSVAITWYQPHGPGRSRLDSVARKAFGKVADVVRMPRLLRQYDVVIVPGMGVFETTLELRPWGWPYALFLMSPSARTTGTKTAFVNVGANVARERSLRWLFTGAARLASYRSYRDGYSRDAMRQMGLDTSGDEVYPDLAFALPEPACRARR